jgi:hypothetical protein
MEAPMPHSYESILSDLAIRIALKQAWQDSNPVSRADMKKADLSCKTQPTT